MNKAVLITAATLTVAAAALCGVLAAPALAVTTVAEVPNPAFAAEIMRHAPLGVGINARDALDPSRDPEAGEEEQPPMPVNPEDVEIVGVADNGDGTTTVVIRYPGGITAIPDFPTVLIPGVLWNLFAYEPPPASGTQGEVDPAVADNGYGRSPYYNPCTDKPYNDANGNGVADEEEESA